VSQTWPGQPVSSPAAEQWPGQPVTAATPAPLPAPPPSSAPNRPKEVIGNPGRPLAPSDGDTIKLDDGNSLRLWGVDAPELRQPGYLPNGSTVPVGAQSRDALADLMGNGDALTGPVVMRSWGRPVAPLTVGGVDAGEQMVRGGNAFAAPDYLADDPDRRFNYMQSERLARQNRLGPVNDAYVQEPAEFRDDPKHIVPRETLAQFWDTPTPNSGLPAAIEQKIVALTYDKDTPLEAVLEYARSRGAILKPESVKASRDHFLKTGQAGGLEYLPTEEILTDTGTGAGGAAVRGIGQGFVAGGLDELGAVADTVIPSIPGFNTGRENIYNSDRRVADIWANNQRQNSSILGYDREFYPYASYGGEIGGALTSGFAIPFGQGARTVPQLAKVGGVWGAAEGFLGTDGDVPQRLIGAAKGAPLGAVAGAGLGKATEIAAPFAGRAFNKVFGRGAQDAARGTGEAVGEFAEEGAQEAVQRSSQGEAGDEWPGTPVAPQGRSIGMDGEGMPAIAGEVRQRDVIDVTAPARATRLDQPLTEAQRRALAEDMRPQDVLSIPSNEVGSVDEAAAIDVGRIAPAKAPREQGALTGRAIKSYTGQTVPKAGPLDMVGWLRSQGGLRDQGGELASMGITNNAARRGMDFVGPETRFGPMVNNEQGMSLDDAALAAWEAGYFPEHTARPDINTFLEALGETYNGGRGRRFLPEDTPELEGYYGRQAERYDLEQQEIETGGPVFVDRSAPADEPAPFPPVEAYEEWPAGGPDFAGNIRLDKLETPQDIKRALVQINHRLGGFDTATRGRIAHAETERLAADLGMSADDLLSRRKGQAFNAEEALAARQILAKSGNELVNLARRMKRMENPGDDVQAAFNQALTRHAAIQEQVSGITAEAARTLSQFRMIADSGAVPREVLASMVDIGGGPKRLQEAADRLLEAVDDGMGRFNTVARKAADPRFSDKLAELYINQILSGPQTHVVNAVSNTLTALTQIPETVIAAGIGGARRLVASQEIDRVMAGELGERLFGLIQGTKEGARFAADAFRTGETSDTFSKIAGHDMRAISGVKGEVIRIPGRLLNTADEFFKGMNRRAEINALSYRKAHKEGLTGEALQRRIAELSANPPENIELRALDFARYMTFQRPLTGVGQDASRMVRNAPWLRPIITFVRTPTNLLKFSVERSPAAPILKEWRADFKAGGARRDLAVARAALGTGFAALFYNLALEGKITGSPPADQAKNRYQRADGWQPYSIRVGDQWVSFSRLDPFATTMGVAADLATKADGMTDRQLDNYAMLLVASIMSSMADKTWLSGVSDTTNALSDPQRYGPSYLRRLGASFLIPNALFQPARTLDPVGRERDTFAQELQARIPGLTDNLLPRRDVWGKPITNEGGVGPDLLSPIWQSTVKDDPVNREMLAIAARNGLPSKYYTVEGVRHEWTPEEYDKLQELRGQGAYAGVTGLISDPAWPAMAADKKRMAVDKVFREATEAAKGAVLFGDVAPQSVTSPAGEWPGEPVQDDASSAEQWPGQAVPQADVVGRLQSSIPGVRFTSGFRTSEYQADMRRRGYKPASNSAHLDGSAIDMLPPPGKSLGWLRSQVARLEPDARLLVHDGHLHATFPGWFGAPVLGGARSAGLSNPVAGKRG
jgi:endonuclease YncB( thermonuclease family)